MVSERIIKADLSQERDNFYFKLNQYDNYSRKYRLVIMDNGIPKPFTAQKTIRLVMQAQGEEAPYYDGLLSDPWEDGYPVINFTASMLSKTGVVDFKFIIYEPSSPETISTRIQHLKIQESLVDYDGIIASEEFQFLADILAQAATVPALIIDINTAIEEVEALIASVNSQMATYQTEFTTMSQNVQDLMTAVTVYMTNIENAAASSAKLSESWAIGLTGTRPGEDTNNSKYHSNQSKIEADRAKTEADRAEQYAGNVDPKNLSQVNAVDSNGLLGSAGATVVSQTLVNKISSDIIQNNSDITNINTELVQKVNILAFNTEVSEIQSDISTISTSLSQKASQTNLNTEMTIRQSSVANLQNQINSIVTQADDYYEKCLNTDSGALLVVSNGAISGQINIADVFPRMSDYTPVAGDYVRKLSNGLTAELYNARIGSDGIAYGSTGDAIRGQFGKIDTNMKNINPDLSNDLQYSYDISQSKSSLSGKLIFLLPYTIYPFYSALIEVYADRDATAYVFLFNDSRTKITAKKGIYLTKGINTINISDIKNGDLTEYIGISSSDGGFTYNSDGSTVTDYDFNYYVTYDTIPNVGDQVSVFGTNRSRLCCNFYLLKPSRAARNIDMLQIKSDFGYDTTPKTSLKSDYNIDIPMSPSADDWIYVLGINSTIPKTATTIKLDIYSNGGTGTIYLITDKEHLIKYKYTFSLSSGINTLEIDVSSYTDNLMVALYSNTTGAFCYQSGSTYEYSSADPMAYYGAWSASYAVGDSISLTHWVGNISTNKSYMAIDLYVTEPIEKRKSNVITVSKYGMGDYTTINEAIRNAGDINSPTVIMLHPGIYEEVVFLRSKHNISIIGTDREQCIVVNKTGKYCNSPMVVSGDFELRNLTLRMTLDNTGSYIPSYNSSNIFVTYPGYALHIDSDSKDKTKNAIGRISNCTCYSEAFPSVGMGVNQNQTIIFENCEFIRNCTNENYRRDNWRGAFIGHSSNLTTAANQNLIIKNCTFESNYGYSGNLNASLGDSANFTLKAINNTFYSDESGVNSFEYNKGLSTLHPMSHGNTALNLNV